MKERVPNTVDDYISAQPEVLRPEQVRAAIRRAVPGAQKVIGYGIPGYKSNVASLWLVAYGCFGEAWKKGWSGDYFAGFSLYGRYD